MIAQVTETAQLNMPIPADLVADSAHMRSHMAEEIALRQKVEAENSILLSRIYSQNEEIAELQELNASQREENASQAETIVDQGEEIDRLHSRINKYDKYHIWLNKLFGNKKIPMAVKLVLWQYYMVVSLMRPNPTDECQVRMDLVAESIGIDSATVRRATDKAEKWELLNRRYQTVEEHGETRKYVHIALAEVVTKNPEDIQMEKTQGGVRVKKCPNPECGSNDVDRYTVQYCRECGENAWYGQPGLRADADVRLAQKANRHHSHPTIERAAPDDATEKQDAFERDITMEVSNRLENAIDQADRKIKKFSQAPTKQVAKAEKQDAFLQSEQVVTEHTSIGLNDNLQIVPAMQKQDAFQKWGPVEIKTPTCHAEFWLNAKGEPAHKLEKHVSSRECGSTNWQWSSENNCRICAKCWAPQRQEEKQ